MTSFYETVYRIVRLIPAGKGATYGQIALLAGRPRAARAVGMAMRQCPYEDVPCQRVVNAAGRVAPFPAFTVKDGQAMLLSMEQVEVSADGTVDLHTYGWKPPTELTGLQDTAVRPEP